MDIHSKNVIKAVAVGLLAMGFLFTFYLVVVSILSGWDFALSQLVRFRYFILALAAGFGIQAGLYTYLRNVTNRPDPSGKVLAVSGTTSTVSMISCCAHYLVNILPIIGATGIIGLVGQYQVELFWVGLVVSSIGILYTTRRVVQFHQQ